MSSKKEIVLYMTINSKHKNITKIIRDVALEWINQLEEDVVKILVMVPSNHLKLGIKYGNLAAVIPEAQYQIVIKNNV